MSIEEIFKQSPQHIQDLPIVQVMMELIRNQAEQIQSQAEQISALKETVISLKDEISRLNNTPKRPKFKPNKMEQRDRKSGSPQANPSANKSNTSVLRKKREEIRVEVKNLPHGSRFKGYSEFSVQDLEITAKEIIYKLAVWQAPNGDVIRAQLPKELRGRHFGTDLRTFIINLYAQGMTQPAILDFLHAVGIEISSGQINNLFSEEAEEFSKVSEKILQAGLKEAPYIRTDDTGSRHKHRNGYCTHIGGQYFAYYKTTFSKSRANFLNILLQGKQGYMVNESMIWHLSQQGVEDDVLNLFDGYKGKKYKSKIGCERLLNKLHLKCKKLRAQCLEGALVGFISAELIKEGQVLLSDRAGQFAILNHAACWIHMERPLRKVPASSKLVKKELSMIRETIWKLYHIVKEVITTQTDEKKVHKRYNALLKMKSTSPTITLVIKNFRKYREELLKALDHPGLPLHNNDSERDIRGFVKRRKISGSTKSEKGKKFRDGLASLKQTCFRLGISFWEYISDWFHGKPPDLAQLVCERYQTANSFL